MNETRFKRAIERIDEENSRDPNTELDGGVACPRELLYSRWLTEWVLKFEPEASEALRLAARCQHICRWAIPRSAYPMTRPGYLKWRQELKQLHAQKAGEILAEAGYSQEMIERVQSLNLKKNLHSDREAQTIEDALCMVFLEHQLGPLAGKTSEDKVIVALQKSWGKMSERGRAAALALDLPPREKALVEKALRSPP